MRFVQKESCAGCMPFRNRWTIDVFTTGDAFDE